MPLPERWVKLHLWIPPAPIFPRVWCNDPFISRRCMPSFPHLLKDDSACVLYTPDHSWEPERDGIVRYMDIAMLWVLKALVWLGTRGNAEWGAWIGPDTSGDVRDDLDNVGPADPCVCGSGDNFGACCFGEYKARAEQLDRLGVPRWKPGTGRAPALSAFNALPFNLRTHDLQSFGNQP
jgi:SEC-C motif